MWVDPQGFCQSAVAATMATYFIDTATWTYIIPTHTAPHTPCLFSAALLPVSLSSWALVKFRVHRSSSVSSWGAQSYLLVGAWQIRHPASLPLFLLSILPPNLDMTPSVAAASGVSRIKADTTTSHSAFMYGPDSSKAGSLCRCFKRGSLSSWNLTQT